MDIQLAKVIYAAGFRAGKIAGNEEAVAYEWGSRITNLGPDIAWDADVQWRLDTDTSYKLNIEKIEDWENI